MSGRNARGVSVVEVFLAAAVLSVVIVAVFGALVQARKVVACGGHRLVMELRARRYLDELASSSYPALLAMRAGVTIPMGEPGDDPAYRALVDGARATVALKEVEPGLMEARVTLAWDEVATGRTSELAAVRLFARSTLSLESRHRLN